MQYLVGSKDLIIMKTELWVYEMLQSWLYIKPTSGIPAHRQHITWMMYVL
jgi:hypothetical protein